MMIAMLVLTVGLIGSMALVSVSIGSNARSKKGSTSVALAEMIIGQISSIPVARGVTSVTITDCAGNNITVNTSGTAGGEGANLTTSGNIDFTQTFSSVTAGYGMRYVVCGVSNGMQSTYDVRWNVKLLPLHKQEFVTVGAQSIGSSTANPLASALPVSLRTVVGDDGN
jgi:Tfp pilus assembly protein PilV